MGEQEPTAAHSSALFQLAERSLLQGEIIHSPAKLFY